MQWTDFVSGDFRDAFDAKIEVRSNMFARDNMFLTLDERKLSSVYFSRRDIATPSRPYSKSERCDIYHKIVEQNSVRYSAKTRIHVVCWTFHQRAQRWWKRPNINGIIKQSEWMITQYILVAKNRIKRYALQVKLRVLLRPRWCSGGALDWNARVQGHSTCRYRDSTYVEQRWRTTKKTIITIFFRRNNMSNSTSIPI